MNSWQLRWVAATALISILVLIYSFFHTRIDTTMEDIAIRREFAKPSCVEFSTGDFAALSQPEWSDDDSTCWEIYLHRKTLNGAPVTLSDYEHQLVVDRRQYFFTFGGIYLAVVLIGSALLYAVVAMFRKE